MGRPRAAASTLLLTSTHPRNIAGSRVCFCLASLIWPMGSAAMRLLLAAPLLAAAALLQLGGALAAAAASSPPVSVSLVSPWAAPPLVLELLEATHTQDPDAFWTLLTHLTGPWAFNDSRTSTAPRSAQAYHAAATRLLQQHNLLAAPGERELWNLALALHTEAPRIAAFWQLYEHSGPAKQWAAGAAGREAQCASWVAWGDEVLCTEQELVRALTSGAAPR